MIAAVTPSYGPRLVGKLICAHALADERTTLSERTQAAFASEHVSRTCANVGEGIDAALMIWTHPIYGCGPARRRIVGSGLLWYAAATNVRLEASMKVRIPVLAATLLLAAVPAQAATPAKADGVKLDGAVIAGHTKIFALAGRTPVVKAFTVGCTTHLKTANDEFEIDWTRSTINGALTKGATLMVSQGPTQDFAIDFGIRTQIPIARVAAEHLASACAG